MIRIVACLGFGACLRRRLDWKNVLFFFFLITRMQASGLIDFQALCGIFNIVMVDLLQHYRVKYPLNKFELIAKIQTVTSGSTTGGLRHHPD